MVKESTICALATAPGNAGIAIIRLSGEEALTILKKVFRKKTEEFLPRYMYLGDVIGKGEVIDRALAVYFSAPASYTGEDVCELHLHGGFMAAKLTMSALMEAGAVPAQPGEFSKRAFINGKMDITQAEAVQDLIGALNEGGARTSVAQLRGKLKEKIINMQDKLTDAIAAIEAGIEYPEENIEQALAEEQLPLLLQVKEDITALINTYDSGRLLKEGAQIAIVGMPNVGKSSLLNSILGEERAIVTDIAGTTRDVIAEYYDLGGVPVKFIDTAGIHDTDDAVEKIGVERSYDAIDNSAMALMLFDASRALTDEDINLYNEIKKRGIPVKIILNKGDAEQKTTERDITLATGLTPIRISALTGENIEMLLDEIKAKVSQDNSVMEGITITSSRHKNSLINAKRSLCDAIEQINDNIDIDCMSIDLKDAWDSLGEITGTTLTEDIVDRIFSKFCLGK